MPLSYEVKVGLFFILSVALFGVMLEIGNHWKLFDRGSPTRCFSPLLPDSSRGMPSNWPGSSWDDHKITVQDSRVQVEFESSRHPYQAGHGGQLTHDEHAGGQSLGLSFGSPRVRSPPGSVLKSAEAFGVDSILDNLGG